MSHPAGSTAVNALAVDTNTAAALINSTEAALEKDRATGHMGIPFVRAGRHVIYSITDLQLWLNANRIVPRRRVDSQTSPAQGCFLKRETKGLVSRTRLASTYQSNLFEGQNNEPT
jgi:hypothetical protein